VNKYFTENGTFSLILHDQGKSPEAHKPKQYQVFNSLIHRYFWCQFEANVEQIQLVLEGTEETYFENSNTVCVSAANARMITWFEDQGQVR
jgi:hypothetical protein